MPQHNNIIANSGLSRDVRMILEVPPKWMVRNGGFLIIAFIILIGVLFSAIKIPQTFASQINFNHAVLGKAYSHQITGTINVANRFLATLKGQRLVKLVDIQNKAIYYYARPSATKQGRDSSLFTIDILQADNLQSLDRIKNKTQLKMNVDLGSASIMAGIIKNHSSN